MSIYDTGTAGLSANGQVTGVGTQWSMPLTLIRVGATLVFKTEPVQIYTISEIISDTLINVINTKGETVPDGTGYAILAHDGISVQGLAQDVAETLRYYQSNNYVTADENGNVEINNGGTGASNAADARNNLGLGSLATLNIAPLANGGTGASNAADARSNLGLGSLATLNIAPLANGGTGASNAVQARANLGLLNGATYEFRTGTFSGSGTVFFGTPFPNNCLVVVCCGESSSSSTLLSASALPYKDSFFATPLYATGGGFVNIAGETFRYIAIGN